MIPSRRNTTSDFLGKAPVDFFDASLSETGMKTMKKVQYQNQLRKLFLNQQQEERGNEVKGDVIKLVHTDWVCKIPELRLKFLPDFETLKKPGFGRICKTWSRVALSRTLRDDFINF